MKSYALTKLLNDLLTLFQLPNGKYFDKLCVQHITVVVKDNLYCNMYTTWKSNR